MADEAPSPPATPATATPAKSADGPEGNPLRSIASVMVGWLVLQWVLWPLFVGMLARVLAGEIEPPSERFLALAVAGMLPNGIIAGLITARIAGWAPVAHAAVLGGLIGFFGMMSSQDAHGLPGWFAIGRVVAPAIAVLLGGVISRAVRQKRG